MRLALLSLFALLLTSCALAQPDTLWCHTFNSIGEDYCFGLQPVPGGYMLAGIADWGGSSDQGQSRLIRTDEHGDTLWTRTFGGDSADVPLALTPAADGGFLLAGYLYYPGSSYYRAWVARVNAMGDVLWTRRYLDSTRAYLRSAAATRDGGFVLGGVADPTNGRDHNLVIRIDANGDTLWTWICANTVTNRCSAVMEAADGGILAAGSITDGFSIPDGALFKLSAQGDSLWSRRFGSTGPDEFYAVQQMADNGLLLAGYAASDSSDSDFWLMRTDANGDSLWSRHFGTEYSDACYSMQLTADGGCVLAGRTNPGGGDYTALVVKAAADGSPVWMRSVTGGSPSDGTVHIATAPDGGYVVGTSAVADGSFGLDFRIFKIASDLDAPEPPLSPNPSSLSLSAYPNPFNGTATLNFSIPRAMPLTLKAYNLLGQQIAVITEGNYTAGAHSIPWDCPACPSGVYVLSLDGNGVHQTHKVMLLK